MTFLLLVAGLAGLVVGGDLLVRGAVAIASRLGVSPLMIGLTLVGFGTSTPELVTSIAAALKGSPAIAIGNVVGSNLANIFLILGLTALISPVAVARRAWLRDSFVLIASALGVLGFALAGHIGLWGGVMLLGALVGYLYWTWREERGHEVPEEARAHLMSPLVGAAVAISGLILVMLGADWTVRAAIDIARGFGISESVIGLTLVAVGTSLPELVTSVVAALRRQGALALGNIVGSNIYNILGILGATAVVMPMNFPPDMMRAAIPAMLAATLALVVAGWTGSRIARGEGAVFFALYVVSLGLIGAAG